MKIKHIHEWPYFRLDAVIIAMVLAMMAGQLLGIQSCRHESWWVTGSGIIGCWIVAGMTLYNEKK